jgi:hypothetical protein
VRSKVHVRLPKGMRDRPTCAHDAGWGDRRFQKRPGSLTTDGCMCVATDAGHWRWPAGGWRSHTRSRDSRVGASFVRRAIAGCLASMSLKPWRNGERARLSLGRLRVRVPSASSGSCSSPVERLVEAQRGAGSIPAGATCLPPWRNAYARRSERRGPRAREGSNPSGGMCRGRVAQRPSSGPISRATRVRIPPLLCKLL